MHALFEVVTLLSTMKMNCLHNRRGVLCRVTRRLIMKTSAYTLVAVLLLVPFSSARAAASGSWVLPNFSDCLDLQVSNPSSQATHALIVLPIAKVSRIAPGFPGSMAIVIIAGSPLAILPSQADDLTGDGHPDEFVFPIDAPPHATLAVHIYYSQTLHSRIPWPQMANASHSFGYNHATAAIESEKIGYRTYGGFFLDVQARAKDHPGLMNELVGFLSASASATSPAGRDVLHIGNTLGLGGLFLQSNNVVFQPPINTPDYAHKPAPPETPSYRVIASGPVRAIIQARMDHWTLGNDVVRVEESFSIAAGDEAVKCHFKISPLSLAHGYSVGAGIRDLPAMRGDDAPGRLALAGQQDTATGPLGLALYFKPSEASAIGTVRTPDGGNDVILFHSRLQPGHAVEGTFWVAAAWSGSGIQNPLQHLRLVERQTHNDLAISGLAHSVTPTPQRLEGEAY